MRFRLFVPSALSVLGVLLTHPGCAPVVSEEAAAQLEDLTVGPFLNDSLWPVPNAWSPAWERLYGDWIGASRGLPVTLTDLSGRAVKVTHINCADWVIVSRLGFAALHGLPFAITKVNGDGTTLVASQYGFTRFDGTVVRSNAPEEGNASRLLRRLGVGERAARFANQVAAEFQAYDLFTSEANYEIRGAEIRVGDLFVSSGHVRLVGYVRREGGEPRELELVESGINMPPIWTGTEHGAYEAMDSLGGIQLRRWRTVEVERALPARGPILWLRVDPNVLLFPGENNAAYFGVALGGNREGQIALARREIEYQRALLDRVPTSCVARTRRENAFELLYRLHSDEDRAAIDFAYRHPVDLVFLELDYSESPTCCWNPDWSAYASSLSAFTMADVVSGELIAAQNDSRSPAAFMRNRGPSGDWGYEPYESLASDYARQAGITEPPFPRWRNSESCPGIDGYRGDRLTQRAEELTLRWAP